MSVNPNWNGKGVRNMSLRRQILGVLIALSIMFVALTYLVQVCVVMPAFVELEQQGAVRDVDRFLDAVKGDLKNLSNTANDWAAWDDSYQYIQDHNQTFTDVNLVDEAFQNTHINLICLFDTERRLVWGQVRDMVTLEQIDVPDLFTTLIASDCPFTSHLDEDDAKQGIVLTSQGPILLASRPSLNTKREGPIHGSVIMGRFLNDDEVAGFAEQTHLDVEVWPVTQADIPVEAYTVLTNWKSTSSIYMETLDSTSLHAYTVLRDVFDQPAILLCVRVPRDVSRQGNVSANMATICGIAGGIFTLLVMWIIIRERIIVPLQAMADHAVRVGKHDDLKARLHLNRRDEIGTLATEFDSMVAGLAESRKKVLDSAHRAGMAEIASEVLHNVGNAVNSANCSVEMLEEQIARSKVHGLERAATLLREQAPRAAEFFNSDPRGPKLIAYLTDLSAALQKERTDNQQEVTRLRETVRHIREAIATQQTFAGRSDFRQEVDLHELIDEILRMNQELIRTHEVRVEVNLPPLPELQLNKSKMTQVLVNLVRNAVQAMQGQPSDHRCLTISARCVDDDGIEIDVSDSGSGFGDEVREKLFTHGFTTKVEGNGFGLHYCANAIREADGHMTAQSAGPGLGATFRIRLPHVTSSSTLTSTLTKP